jgi:hypothetical protein
VFLAVPTDPETILSVPIDPAAYMAANNSDPDTLKWHQAIKEDDWELFYEAAQKEIQTLQDIGTWEEAERSKVPKGANILPGTWVFKRKRFPDGKLRKHKARYCVRGDMQEAGVDYDETRDVRACYLLVYGTPHVHA